MKIEVFDNQIEAALKQLKKQMLKEGLIQEMKRRQHYEKPSVKRKRKAAQARKKRRKDLKRPLELFQPADERVALRGERGDLPLANGVALVLLSDLRLQLGLAPVEVLQLGLEPGDALLGRQVAHEEHVEDHQDQQDARRDEKPWKCRARLVRHRARK